MVKQRRVGFGNNLSTSDIMCHIAQQQGDTPATKKTEIKRKQAMAGKERILISTIFKAFDKGVKRFVRPNFTPNERKDAENV